MQGREKQEAWIGICFSMEGFSLSIVNLNISCMVRVATTKKRTKNREKKEKKEI